MYLVAVLANLLLPQKSDVETDPIRSSAANTFAPTPNNSPAGSRLRGMLVCMAIAQSKNSSLMVTPKSWAMARRASSVMVWRIWP